MASASASVKGRAVRPRSRSALAVVKNIRYFDIRRASSVTSGSRPVKRAMVSAATASGTIADRGRQLVLGDHALDQPLGGDLAALVDADRLGLVERERLVDRAAVAPHRQRRDAAGVDDALDAGAQRLLHHDAGAGDVVAHDL